MHVDRGGKDRVIRDAGRLTEEVGDGQYSQGDGDSGSQHHFSKPESSNNGTRLTYSSDTEAWRLTISSSTADSRHVVP